MTSTFLLFTLYAPLAAMGNTAVGERRTSWPRPARSAVLGLVSGALGKTRDDLAHHQTLQRELYYAVQTEALGEPLTDYHTIQVKPTRQNRSYSTRMAELADGEVDAKTILSQREWYSDTMCTVALWPKPDASVDLAEIHAALQQPTYTVYFGRKSASLGLPLNPILVEAKTFLDAFDQRTFTELEADVLGHILAGSEEEVPVACDADIPDVEAIAGQHRRLTRRMDSIVSRTAWQFESRDEILFSRSTNS